MRNGSHIILVGPMGSGKSTLGRLLAARLGMDFVDVDDCVGVDTGRDIPGIFASEGEAGFRAHEARALAQALAGSPAVIATGGGAVLAAGNRTAMRAGRVVYLQVDPATQSARLEGETGRPLLAFADRTQRLAEIQSIREPLYREVAHHLLDTSSLSPEDAASALMALLEQPGGPRA